MISVTYVGKREHYVENCYGSKIAFSKGETKAIDDGLAAKLLKHPDQYRRGDDAEVERLTALSPQDVADDTDDTDDTVQNARDLVASMEADALVDYAQTHFNGIKLNKRKTLDNLRGDVLQLIDQYGVS